MRAPNDEEQRTMSTIFAFNHTPIPAISQVGGKAHSLITMTNAGYAVPNGFVCSADFFEDWTRQIETSSLWKNLLQAVSKNETLTEHTNAIKAMIKTLEFSPGQTDAVNAALPALKSDALYAVRSSSPEEDLEGSSFAGIYETVLGVDKKDLKKAIRTVFDSAFDERVFVYKKAKGFAVDKVKIAVIIMEQINSDMAGVGFSVNPINNDYDEAAINANYGLGESVVSGIVSPDYFVVSKTDGSMVSKTLGNKARSVFLAKGPDGGTHEKENTKSDDFCLTDDQAREITDMIKAVEKLYGTPMDIEWSFAAGQLYMIQARPITTHIPLPPDMLTEPGAKKRTLYYDVSVLEGITTNKPITTMTQDWTLGQLSQALAGPFLGNLSYSADGNPKTDFYFGKGVRIYMNFSQLFFLMSPKSLGKSLREADESVGEALIHLDKELYTPEHKFPSLQWHRLLPFTLRRVLASRHPIHLWIQELVNPIHFKDHTYTPVAEQTQEQLVKLADYNGTIEDYLAQSGKVIGTYFESVLPVVTTYIHHLGAVSDMFKDSSAEISELADKLTMGIEGDEAINLGITLYNMARLLPADAFEDIESLIAKCKTRDLPDDFMVAWDRFLAEQGMRGPNEMEIANPKYGDDPKLAFGQMASMRNASSNPADALKRHAEGRKSAYKTLMETLPQKQSKKLKHHYEIVQALAPTRDTMKYHLVQIAAKLRALALRDGSVLLNAGRLDTVDDVFFLTFAEITSALPDTSIDLKALVGRRKPEFESAAANVRSFPVLIDSRGRIPSAPTEATDDGARQEDSNVLRGSGISRGIARGRVKILKDPREKTIEQGDILVTYNTDPGWTPLFIGAAGIVLEIGGVLQHGGVVAREYAKPCVAGIRNVMDKLQDGQMIEVDGTKGTVTLLVG